MTKDPVCACDVDEMQAITHGLSTDLNGRVYFFCSEDCKKQFDADPSQFADRLPEWEESERSWPVQ